MRLTLRTMLAYLDDVLEPADAELLGKKIQESEFAGGLVHRILTVMRKLRLGAPKLDGHGMGLDPNTVAEYLDSTLSPDRVPDFEKVCLESDVHLAEVASCHQVLTLVLGEPAEVTPAVRQRVYGIASMASSPASVVSSHSSIDDEVDDEAAEQKVPAQIGSGDHREPGVNPVTSQRRIPRGKPEVPDYLRASSKRRLLPYLATSLLVFLIATIAFLIIGPERLLSLAQTGPATPKAPAQAIDEAPDSSSRDVSPELGDEALATNLPPGSTDSTDWQPAVPGTPPSDTVNETPTVESTSRPVIDQPTVDGTTDELPDPPEPLVDVPSVTSPQVFVVNDELPSATTKDAPASTEASSREGPSETIATKPILASELGKYISEKQVLARFDPAMDDWFRLPTNSVLAAGDRLLVLPSYRPQLALASGVQLTFAGPSLVELGTSPAHGLPLLSIDYGRVKLVTIGRADTQVAFRIGGRESVVTFANASAALALEVVRYLPPGANPENQDDAHEIVQITATSGRIVWEAEGEVVPIEEGHVHVILNEQPGRTVRIEEYPGWISSPGPSVLEQIAVETLQALIDEERPIVVSLEERVNDDRVEVKSLVSSCLGQLGRHESLLGVLGDRLSRSYWDAGFYFAQQSLARSPESALVVKAALEKHRSDEAADLYRLLWGYSQKQLTTEGAADKLVEYLSHDLMEVRVLAFINLRHITGKTLLYQPEAPLRRRAIHVQAWRDRAQAGEIVFAHPLTLPVPAEALEPASSTPGETTP